MTERPMTEQPVSEQPVITAAGLAAGHDGLAEVAIVVRYPNGAERTMSLPYASVSEALDASAITDLDDLIGRPWTALTVDHNSASSTGTPVSNH
jgi:hypothetical protein